MFWRRRNRITPTLLLAVALLVVSAPARAAGGAPAGGLTGWIAGWEGWIAQWSAALGGWSSPSASSKSGSQIDPNRQPSDSGSQIDPDGRPSDDSSQIDPDGKP